MILLECCNAIVAQLSLVADFLDLRNDQSLILNNNNDEA